MPLEPMTAPSIGEGGVFDGIDYSKPLVIGVLAFILLSLYGFIRTDVGFRILRASQARASATRSPSRWCNPRFPAGGRIRFRMVILGR